MDLKDFIRDVPDFPQEGILFRDITPILKNPDAFKEVITRIQEKCSGLIFDSIIGVESRGFIFGAPLACQMGKSFVPVRKEGKLPGHTISASYSLEYGTSTLEIHTGDITPGNRVLIIDDLLATGGTIEATAELVEKSQGLVAGIGLVIELAGLGGRDRLNKYEVFSLIQY